MAVVGHKLHLASHSRNRAETDGAVIAEVATALDAASDGDSRYPEVYEHGGNVVVTRGVDVETFERARICFPRVVWTLFNDTADSGHGRLYERLGDGLVEVDSVSSLIPDYHGYVPDYFSTNYGIAARYDYDRTGSPGPTERVTAETDWPTILATDWEEVPVAAETLREWAEAASSPGATDEERVADVERVAELLDYDGLYRPAAAVLRNLDELDSTTALADSALADLQADDRVVRDRAIRRLAAVGVADLDRYRRLLGALPTAGERTRALVAADLWQPTPLDGSDADTTLVSSLLSLTDDPVPELRLGGFVGATRAIDRLHRQATTVEPDLEPELERTAEPFFEAYAALLADEDPRVRGRTTRMIGELLGSPEASQSIDGIWLRASFPVRWRVVRRLEENIADETLATSGRLDWEIPEAFDGEPSAVPTLVNYAYHDRDPSYRELRATLARFAERHPEGATELLGPAVAAVWDGDAVAADLRLLYALAPHRPEQVASVAAELAGLLDRDAADGDDTERTGFGDRLTEPTPEQLRREAARVLSALPIGSHSVDRARLRSVLGGVTQQRLGAAKLVPDQVAALAEVAPEAAADGLREAVRGSLGEDGTDRVVVESAVEATARVAPTVVAETIPELAALLDSPADVSAELAVGLALTAQARPAVVAERAPVVGSLLGHYEPAVREAAATALVAASRADDAVLATPFETLVARGNDAAPSRVSTKRTAVLTARCRHLPTGPSGLSRGSTRRRPRMRSSTAWRRIASGRPVPSDWSRWRTSSPSVRPAVARLPAAQLNESATRSICSGARRRTPSYCRCFESATRPCSGYSSTRPSECSRWLTFTGACIWTCSNCLATSLRTIRTSFGERSSRSSGRPTRSSRRRPAVSGSGRDSRNRCSTASSTRGIPIYSSI